MEALDSSQRIQRRVFLSRQPWRASRGALARLEVFDWQKGERTHEFPGDKFNGLFERLAFHPQGKWLLGAGGDHNGFIKFIDLEAKKVIRQEKAPMHIHDLVVDEKFERIYAAGHGKIVVWEMRS